MKSQTSSRGSRPANMERVYVKVNSDFDSTGYMQPRSITWSNGKTYMIDAIKDYRPASCYRQGEKGSCYTVMIQGKEKHLFFEWTDSVFATRIARWYIELPVSETAR